MATVPLERLTRQMRERKPDGATMELRLRRDNDGFTVVDGHMRLKAALSMTEKVVVNAPGLGKVVIIKMPDGRLMATQDEQTLRLFGL